MRPRAPEPNSCLFLTGAKPKTQGCLEARVEAEVSALLLLQQELRAAPVGLQG